MQADTIRLIFTYITALVVVVGGGAFLLITRNDPASANNGLIVGAVISVVTLAVNFVFTKETQSGQARASERAFAQGQASNPNPTDPTPGH